MPRDVLAAVVVQEFEQLPAGRAAPWVGLERCLDQLVERARVARALRGQLVDGAAHGPHVGAEGAQLLRRQEGRRARGDAPADGGVGPADGPAEVAEDEQRVVPPPVERGRPVHDDVVGLDVAVHDPAPRAPRRGARLVDAIVQEGQRQRELPVRAPEEGLGQLPAARRVEVEQVVEIPAVGVVQDERRGEGLPVVDDLVHADDALVLRQAVEDAALGDLAVGAPWRIADELAGVEPAA